MSVDVAEARIPVYLTYHEARALRSTALGEAKRKRAYAQRHPFTPAPGKLDSNISRAEILEAGAAKLDLALTAGITAHKEAANGQ